MSRDIKESDWQLLRELAPLALDRFCERVLGEVTGVATDGSRSNHERYAAVFARKGTGSRAVANV